MHRAFEDLVALGWVSDPMPRLVSVQAEGCAPIARAFDRGETRARPWEDAATCASGLRVPAPFADALILAALRDSSGCAVTVSEGEMLDGMLTLSEQAGCFACPEGGATVAALVRLAAATPLERGARVVIYNTGSGLKYPEAWRAALARRDARTGAPAS